MHSRLAAGFVSFGDTTFDQDPASIDRDDRDFDLVFATTDEKYLFGVGHRYSTFDIEPLPVASNGYLHTTFLPFHFNSGDDRKNFRVSVAAALSSSSNGYKHLGDLGNDAFQFLAAIVWSRPLSENASLSYGICGDHRFGDYQVYPSVSMLWQPHPDWDVELGFPDSTLRYRISEDFGSELRIFPDGNEWFVLDRSRTVSSVFVYEAYAVEWAFDWRFLDNFTLAASVGLQFGNEYEMTLLDQSRIALSNDPVTRIGAAIEWRF